MTCECWMEEGVRRAGQALYRCAACDENVSGMFFLLLDGDEGFADQLIEKGLKQEGCAGKTVLN